MGEERAGRSSRPRERGGQGEEDRVHATSSYRQHRESHHHHRHRQEEAEEAEGEHRRGEDAPRRRDEDVDSGRRRRREEEDRGERGRGRSPYPRQAGTSSHRERDRDRGWARDHSRERDRDSSRKRSRTEEERRPTSRSARPEGEHGPRPSGTTGSSNSTNTTAPLTTIMDAGKVGTSLKRELESYKNSLQFSSVLPEEIEEVLNKDFVWGKKREAEKRERAAGGAKKRPSRQEEDTRIAETKAELEKLAAKRAERELEMQQRELERALQFGGGPGGGMTSEDWQEKEADFYLDQAKFKARVRIKEGRAHPIDFLAINLLIARDDELLREFCTLGFFMESKYPYECLAQLSLGELVGLEGEMEHFLSFDLDPLNQKFWNLMLIVCREHITRASPTGHAGVSAQVVRDVDSMFEGKAMPELQVLQQQIQDKLASGEPMDVEYWDFALRSLEVWKAKAKLQTYHDKLLAKFWAKHADPSCLQVADAPASSVDAAAQAATIAHFPRTFPLEYARMKAQVEGLAQAGRVHMTHAAIMEAREAAALARSVGLYKPVRFKVPVRTEVGDEEAGQAPAPVIPIAPGAVTTAVDPQDRKSRVEDDFREEVPSVLPATYPWEGTYPPLKPKYINRVVSGYVWNQYNRTHYDSSNPPPKFIQGYKFNIFYPDLVDPSVTPSFQVTRDPAVPGTAILRFYSGAPYQDIAFRIPDRLWELKKRRGYKCNFDKGVLQLWFSFKRER